MALPDKSKQQCPKPGPEHVDPALMMQIDHVERKWLDIAYADQSPSQKMDIYLPGSGNGPFPVILSIHGGAWFSGDKRDMLQVPMLRGIEKGYAVICINYRLSGEKTFPGQIFDCKAAIRFIKSHANRFMLDASRIAVWGASAGAHLASLIGTSAGVQELEDLSMGNAQISSAVQAVVDWFGPCENFIKLDEQFIASGLGIPDHSKPDSPESRLLGRRITEVPVLVKFASPKTYASKDIPPFFIQHGSLDQVVPVEQSIIFADVIRKNAGAEKVNLEIIPGARHHGDPVWDTVEMSDKVFRFFEKWLKK